jgi:hypothetical protein
VHADRVAGVVDADVGGIVGQRVEHGLDPRLVADQHALDRGRERRVGHPFTISSGARSPPIASTAMTGIEARDYRGRLHELTAGGSSRIVPVPMDYAVIRLAASSIG